MSDLITLSSDELTQRIRQVVDEIVNKASLSLQSSAPPAPVILQNSKPDSEVFAFSWLPVDDDKVAGYNVYKADSKINPDVAERVTFIPQPPAPGRGYSLTFKDSRPLSQSKFFWVSSVNAAGTESPKVAATRLFAGGAPGAVRNFVVEGWTGKFKATWDDPLENIITLNDYVIQYANDANFTDIVDTVRVGKVNSKEGFAPGVTYYWRIVAHNASPDTTNTDPVLLAYLPHGWGPWTIYDHNGDGVADPVTSGSVRDEDTDVPSAPYIAVVVGKLSETTFRFTFGAEIPTEHNNTVTRTQFQIAKGSDTTFTDPVHEVYGGVPFNGTWVTGELNQFHFRARVENAEGWSPWSAVITLATTGVTESADTGVPSAPQNVTVIVDDVDPAVDGKELVVQWDRSALNYNTLFAYAVQIHTSATFPVHQVIRAVSTGQATVGDVVLYDPTANFNDSVVGKTLWIHSASPMTEANLISTGHIVTKLDAWHLEVNMPIRADGAGLHYQIIVPDWEQVFRSYTANTSILDMSVEDNTHFKLIARDLPLATYYVRVKAANAYGIGPWSATVSGAVDGFKTDDIKNSAITAVKLGPGSVTTDKIDNAAVTALKIANAAIDRARMAVGLQPVQVVAALPSGVQGDVAFLTTDSKLYRHNGSTWVKEIPTSDLTGTITNTQIADDSISTPKLQALAITAAKIAAETITGDKVVAGTISSGLLSATAIDGKLITGATLRTSATNPKIQLDSTSGIRGISTGGDTLFQVSTDGIVTLKTAASGSRIELDATNGLRCYSGSTLKTQILPSAGIMGTDEVTGIGNYLQLSGGGSNAVVEIGGVSGQNIMTFKTSGSTRCILDTSGNWQFYTDVVLAAGKSVDANTNSGRIRIANRGDGTTDTPSGLAVGEVCIWWGASSHVYLAVNDGGTHRKVLLS